MRRVRLGALTFTLGLAVLGAAVVIALDPIGTPGMSPSPSRVASPAPTTTSSAPGTGLLEVVASGVGPRFPVEAAGPPTGDVGQSKLWVHAGTWWAVLVADGTPEFRIHRFDWAGGRWLDTGTRVAPRGAVLPDALAAGDVLWVAAGGQPTARRGVALVRYTFDPEFERYVRDADFPVTISTADASSLTLARDAAGRLWAAWIGEDGLVVSRTEGSDWSWTPPAAPPVPGVATATGAVSIVAYGETVALVWTNRGRETVSVAIPALAGEAWQRFDVVVDGLQPSEDDISANALETDAGLRLFIAVRASLDAPTGAGPGDPRVLLLVVEADGTSRQYLVGRQSDHHTRPVVLLDAENRLVYVVASLSGVEGAVYYKVSGIEDILFAPGPGTPLIEASGLAALASATSTKQTLGSSTGLVVLASDAEAGSYAWVAARLPGPGEPNVDAAPELPAADELLLHDTFNPFEPGTALDPMWVERSSGEATFAIADVSEGRRVAASASPDGSAVRTCREFLPIARGRLRIEADVMLSRVGGSDATITAARHDGTQSAVVRLDDSGVFSYFDGAGQVRSEVPYATGVWYTSVVEIDLDAATYDWSMERSSDGVAVFSVNGAAWRAPATGPVNEVCFESAEAVGQASVLAIDRIRVER